MTTPYLSIVIPFLDEVGSLEQLVERIRRAMENRGWRYEIVLVNDGSRDGSREVAEEIAHRDHRVTLVSFTRNFGKAAALSAGMKQAAGEVIATMDADLQDDPAELPRLIERLDQGFDVVGGWKKERHDPPSKRLPSKLFNLVVSRLFGLSMNDMNCGLKVYRRRAVSHLRLYGELHRFAPALLFAQGFKVAELPVTHHPRMHGRSKYGSARLAKGLLDMLTVVLLTRYRARPLHLFGFAGLPITAVGGMILLYLTILWFAGLGPIGDRPLLILGVLLVITGIQFLGIGLIAELVLASDSGSEDRYVIDAIVRAEPEVAATIPVRTGHT